MYTDLLNRAIRSLKAGKDIKAEDIEDTESPATEIDLQIPALLPQDYLPDVHTRLIMYKRIANATDAEALYELQIEMIDRFGLLPDPVKALIRLTEFRIEAMALGTPVMAFRVGGIPEVIIHGEQGRLIEPEDEAGAAKTCIKILRTPKELERMRQNGPPRVAAEFSAESMANRVTELYRGILARR